MGDNPKEYPIYKYVKYPIDPFTIDPNSVPGHPSTGMEL